MNPKTDIDKRVIEAIERIMLETGINTDKGISRHLGQNELFFYNVKKGKQSATVDVIGKLHTMHNISLDWLFGGANAPKRGAENTSIFKSNVSSVKSGMDFLRGKSQPEPEPSETEKLKFAITELEKEISDLKAENKGLIRAIRAFGEGKEKSKSH